MQVKIFDIKEKKYVPLKDLIFSGISGQTDVVDIILINDSDKYLYDINFSITTNSDAEIKINGNTGTSIQINTIAPFDTVKLEISITYNSIEDILGEYSISYQESVNFVGTIYYFDDFNNEQGDAVYNHLILNKDSFIRILSLDSYYQSKILSFNLNKLFFTVEGYFDSHGTILYVSDEFKIEYDIDNNIILYFPNIVLKYGPVILNDDYLHNITITAFTEDNTQMQAEVIVDNNRLNFIENESTSVGTTGIQVDNQNIIFFNNGLHNNGLEGMFDYILLSGEEA